MGEPVLILAFVVIVIGGIGSVKGALVGSILVGLTETLGRFLLPWTLREGHGTRECERRRRARWRRCRSTS